MQFVLTGFKQESGYRVFAFDGISTEHVRVAFRVRADLGLIQRYGIRIQELPLLCRGFLELHHDESENRALTYTETEMKAWARESRAAKEAGARKWKPVRPASTLNGAARRAPLSQ